MEFPELVLDWMIGMVEKCIPTGPTYDAETFKEYDELLFKLREIKHFDDVNKKNRWFGYYQKVGENLRIWDLDDITNKVRREKWSKA